MSVGALQLIYCGVATSGTRTEDDATVNNNKDGNSRRKQRRQRPAKAGSSRKQQRVEAAVPSPNGQVFIMSSSQQVS